MLGLLSTMRKEGVTGVAGVLRELEEENQRSEGFFREVENWRNVEQNYIAKVAQVASNLRDRAIRPVLPKEGEGGEEQEAIFCACSELARVLQVAIDNHKSFLSKINYDIFLVNCDSAQKLLAESKKYLEEEKQQQREMAARRQQVEKAVGKREKLRRAKEEEEMMVIFLQDSVDSTIDQKMRKKNRIKQLEKELEEFELKVRETLDDYARVCEKNKEGFARIRHNYREQGRCKVETLLKLNLHLTTYWRNLQAGLLDHQRDSPYSHAHQPPPPLSSKLEHIHDDLMRVALPRSGFVETSLRLIQEGAMEELLEYSRDKEVKTRVKRMMETDEVNPNETDQASRQVKLVKKMLLQEEVDRKCMEIFRGLVNKNSKLRMNFVFILQFFRINSQFEIALPRIHCLHCLISEFLEACHVHRDSFVLKQLMVLLMTYFVTHRPEPSSQPEKIYIIHFFKKNPLWRDIEYWESVLLECIFIEKRNTVNAVILSDLANPNKRKELQEAERLAILNQLLMVVRNMVIFDFTQKEVKAFASRFIKLLRQDEKFHKDVFNTIEDAVKEETKLHLEQKQVIKDYYLNNLIKAKSEQYSVPEDVRRSYTM